MYPCKIDLQAENKEVLSDYVNFYIENLLPFDKFSEIVIKISN